MFPQYQNQFRDDDHDSNLLFQFISDLDQPEIHDSIITRQQQQQQQQPVYWDFAAGTSSISCSPDGKRKGQRRPETPADVEAPARKKIVHRDVERQRRQEMATLHTSLRDLLPVEYIKGKRSVSDHLGGALSYIKDLQKRLEGLGTKRDDLKKVSASAHSKSSTMNRSYTFVQVRPCLDGVQVVIGSCLELSKAMQVLLQEGLTVVSCISTRIEEEMIHTIQTKISNAANVDISQLEQKLIRVLTSN